MTRHIQEEVFLPLRQPAPVSAVLQKRLQFTMGGGDCAFSCKLSRAVMVGRIDALLRKWLAHLSHPYTADNRAAGIRYDVSVLQAEFALTQVFDRPVQGGCSSRRSCVRTSIWAVPSTCGSATIRMVLYMPLSAINLARLRLRPTRHV